MRFGNNLLTNLLLLYNYLLTSALDQVVRELGLLVSEKSRIWGIEPYIGESTSARERPL